MNAADDDNIFADCEDRLFSSAESEYEQQRRKELERAACKVERKRLMVSSDRYLDTLKRMQEVASETETKIAGLFGTVYERLRKTAGDIEDEAEKSLRSVKKHALRTEKLVKLTSRQHRFRFATLLASAFLCGVMVTVFVYHAFIIGIMNKYLHHTIEVMAQQEILQARKEADQILRNANIKADGILQNAEAHAANKNMILQEGGKK